uniref:Uncharacterized protein n=1 Tax=Anguilla anguilla TaxID=7936 RepID=A0A0E9UYC5_ANGAN
MYMKCYLNLITAEKEYYSSVMDLKFPSLMDFELMLLW